MEIGVIVHEAEEVGFWAEVPTIPGWVTQGGTFERTRQKPAGAADYWLSVDAEPRGSSGGPRSLLMEMARLEEHGLE